MSDQPLIPLDVLRAALERLNAGRTNPQDEVLVQQAQAAGQITISLGSRSVAISGGAQGATIITGDITLTDEALERLLPKPYQPPTNLEQGKLPEPGSLPPGSRIPFARNAVFTGRESDLLALADALLYSSNGAAIGIVQASTVATGLGGIGKSQLAVEFCYRYGRYFHGVHWLQANQDMHAEIAACGEKMGLYPWPEKQPEQVQVTLAAWGRGGQRLVVLDNAEDPAVVQEWLPQLDNAAVLLTARRAEWPVDLGLKQHPLDTLPRSESLALLRKLADRLEAVPADELEKLAARLGDLPLALDLAGRYLKRRGRLSVAGYLKELAAAGSALEHESQTYWTNHSPTKHATSLVATFQLSWGQVQDNLARRIFKVAGYCAPGVVIPWEILECGVGEGEVVTNSRIELAVSSLGDLGLGVVSDAGLTMHPLLAEFGRGEDRERKSLPRLVDGLGKLTKKAADIGHPREFQPLSVHALIVVETADPARVEDAGALWNNLGRYFHSIGDYKFTQIAYKRGLELAINLYGLNHSNTAIAINNWGGLWQSLRNYDVARECFQQALAIDEKLHGANHPDVARDKSNLGTTLQELGDFSGAQNCLEQALRIDEEWFGSEHPNIAIRSNNLGMLFYAIDDFRNARIFIERALNINKKNYGFEHPQVATSLNNFGGILNSLGELAQAQSAYKQALTIDEAVFGLSHPAVARDNNNLGMVLKTLGDLDAARRCLERALEIYEQYFPPEHPLISGVRENLQSLSSEK
jgi:tetratricopeptide (TPR) repeat protein